MQELQGLYEFLLPHWPGVAWLFIAMLITQVEKGALFTKKRAHTKGKAQWFWWWGYKTLALHGAFLGAIVGIIWQNPEGGDPAWPWAASLVYFAFFGGMSVFAYEVLRGLLKKRNIDIGTLPGQDAPKTDEGGK
jgi:hypothetical protein